ncbi:hypothetical protein [Luteibacter aegosomatissinici]|uniref:hypothetical protein n=1 Tax=Luteibacter aegosomatissinici TaxID=2911539 RepID=UPI003CCD156A
MTRIHSTNTKPELAVHRTLHSPGNRSRASDCRFPGRPDITSPRRRWQPSSTASSGICMRLASTAECRPLTPNTGKVSWSAIEVETQLSLVSFSMMASAP